MSEQYLILHKVRGEPSFDCATKLEMDGEDWWITNSGYRAYPVWHAPLIDTIFEGNVIMKDMPPVPADWPDHFEVRNEGPKQKLDVTALFAKLMPKLKRRI